MTSKILVVGGDGNMGSRYKCILDQLGVRHETLDIGTGPKDADEFDGVIIATPTDTHTEILDAMVGYKGPVLCEKPLLTDFKDIEVSLIEYMDAEMRLSMVNQYKYAVKGKVPDTSEHVSYYTYFNSGQDGLEWDCINIIAQSNSRPYLSKNSPIWSCCLNGVTLTRKDIDISYIKMLEDWLESGLEDYAHIIKAHKKVRDYINDEGSNRDSSKKHVH
jgi:hypothetical protein